MGRRGGGARPQRGPNQGSRCRSVPAGHLPAASPTVATLALARQPKAADLTSGRVSTSPRPHVG